MAESETGTETRFVVHELRRGCTRVRVTNYGATVMSFTVLDRHGYEKDIVLGFGTPEEYQTHNAPYFGCVVGRVANRIAGAKFELDGVTYTLPANDGPNTLHGGTCGLDKQFWEVDKSGLTEECIRLTLLSADGDQGFPSLVKFSVTYNLHSHSELSIQMEAEALTKRTPISMAHHMYWNLDGHKGGSVLDHQLWLNAPSYTPTGPTLIPTGDIKSVAGTPFDFTSPTPIGSRISEVEGGYDHNFALSREAPEGRKEERKVLEEPGQQEEQEGRKEEREEQEGRKVGTETVYAAARARSDATGITLALFTNAPGLQFYSGNFLDGTLVGKQGAAYAKHAGFCLETQGFPNAVNEPRFPSIIVSPGAAYNHVMLIQATHD